MVNEVSKSIYGVPIINSVSMTIVSGNVYGFQGINGSGKTMLMRLICGLIYPTTGQIVLDGAPAAVTDADLTRIYGDAESEAAP